MTNANDSFPATWSKPSRIDQRVDAITQSVTASLDQGAPSQPLLSLYNDAGLEGILRSRPLWLTGIFDLNDPSELRHGSKQAAESQGGAQRTDTRSAGLR